MREARQDGTAHDRHPQVRRYLVDHGLQTIIYPIRDLANAKALYGALLDTSPYVDEAYYVGFRVGDQEVGLDPHGHSKG